MKFENWQQKRRIAPMSSPHQRPNRQGIDRVVGSPRLDEVRRGVRGKESRLPPRYSHTAMNHWRVFIDHPKNKRRTKNKLVGRSMQKKDQPRFTMMKVRAQLKNLLPTEGDRVFFGATVTPKESSAGSPGQLWMVDP